MTPDLAGQAWRAAVAHLEENGRLNEVRHVRRDGDVCQVTMADSESAQVLVRFRIPHPQVLVPAAMAFFDGKRSSMPSARPLDASP